MAASGAPQWLQTVNKKHLARENAINSFLETHKTRLEVNISGSTNSGPGDVTAIDDVQDTLRATSSGTVTALTLCVAYVHRAIEAHRRVPLPAHNRVLTTILTATDKLPYRNPFRTSNSASQ
ncbi:hypothetical protein B5807_05879 [Epicoccum nigrum]|uniref:Uncharacterized protein n=1 Tax=Epicoccum nigrum TaxID=105696 RepID=A0A1Y2M0Q4_EPING|nr:hypothetical protein B5807_05879 [Epicoccum nigrum]